MALDLDAPISWQTVEDAISDWVTSAIGLATHWADQDAPQPARPFVLLSIAGPVELGIGDEKRTVEAPNSQPAPDDLWQEQTRGEREITITVQVEVDAQSSQDPRRHARAQATRLFSSLTIDSITNTLEAAGLAYRARNPIQNFSIPIADEFVNRSAFEFRAGLASCVVEDISVIERVTGTGTISGAQDGGTISVPIDIDSTP
jgi:hypothetical protein